MGKYDGIAKTALELIKAKGAEATISRTTEASYDPVTQVNTTPVTSSATASVVGLPPARDAEKHVGSLEGRNLQLFYIAMRGLSLAPIVGDTITWGSTKYSLIWKQTYDPAADGAILTVAYGETR